MNKFVIMWCEDGLECIIPIDLAEYKKYENDCVAARLADEEMPDIPTELKKTEDAIRIMELRAQVNSQRFYEIYNLDTTESITKNDLEKLFEESPQMIVNLIREKGVKISGSGRGKNKPKIF